MLSKETEELLAGFESRMKFVNIIKYIKKHSFTDEIKEFFPGNQDIMDNLVISLLLFIMDSALRYGEKCTKRDISRFLGELSEVYGYPADKSDILTEFIVTDVLRNGGRLVDFDTYISSNGVAGDFRPQSTIILTDNKGCYDLTEEAYDFLFRTKEIDTELDFSVSRFKLREFIKRGNYSKVLGESNELVSRVRKLKGQMNSFILRCKTNISKVSSVSYEENENNIVKSTEDNKHIFARKEAVKKEERDILKELDSLNRKNDRFDEICIKMNEFYGILGEISENEGSIRSLDKRISEINEGLENANKLSSEYEERQRVLAAQRSEYTGVISETEGGSSGVQCDELLSENYDILKARYEASKQKFSEDKGELSENISKCGRKISELRDELGRMSADEAEYSSLEYSPEKAEQAEEKIKAADEEWKSAVGLKSLLESECRQLREKITEVQGLIARTGRELLPKSEIGSEFDARAKECARRIKALENDISERSSDIYKYTAELSRSEKISEKYPETEKPRLIEISDNMTEDIRERIDRSEKALMASENSFLDRFTHLATADIVGCFDNAYNLKLKARPLSSVETLESENLRQMEFAFRRGEQMTLM